MSNSFHEFRTGDEHIKYKEQLEAQRIATITAKKYQQRLMVKSAQGESPAARNPNQIADKYCMSCNTQLPQFYEKWYCVNCPKCRTCNEVKVTKKF